MTDWQVTVEPEKREKRFCLCGYPVAGTELERLDLLEKHWKSRMHRRRLKEQGK